MSKRDDRRKELYKKVQDTVDKEPCISNDELVRRFFDEFHDDFEGTQAQRAASIRGVVNTALNDMEAAEGGRK